MIAMFETTFDFPLLLVNNKHLQSTKKFPTEVIELFSVVGGRVAHNLYINKQQNSKNG